MKDLWQYAIEMGWLQWFAFVFSILYVIYAARENIWCWLFGMVSVSFLFVIYYQTRLFSDALLQVFYMAMAVYGWITWSQTNKEGSVPITTLSPRMHFVLIAVGFGVALLLGKFWTYFDAALPYVDAFTSSFSIIATFMVARKILENWLYWIVIDLVCIFVYIDRSIYLIAFLFLVYTLLAVYGWKIWYHRWILSKSSDLVI